MKHIYVAGPLSSDPIGCTLTAINHGNELLRAGLFPFIPHLSVWLDKIHPQDYERWMRYDFAWISKCDALFRFPGHSPGADREIEYAKRLGIPVFHDVESVIEWAKRHEDEA